LFIRDQGKENRDNEKYNKFGSSIKFQLIEMPARAVICTGMIDRID
jgi:hypothetical protein